MKKLFIIFSFGILFSATAQSEQTIYRLQPGQVCKWGYEQSMPNGNNADTWCVKANDWMDDGPFITMDFSSLVPDYDLFRPAADEEFCPELYVANYRGIKGILWCSEVNEHLISYRPIENEQCLEGFVEKYQGLKDVRWCVR